MATQSPSTEVQSGIDPRSPRFGASITAIALLVVVYLALDGRTTAAAIVLAVIATLFAWGAFAGIRRHPYGWVFRTLIRPRLAPPTSLEDAAPPTFAQGVGLFVTAAGLTAFGLGVEWAIAAAAAAAFIAAFLNAAFAYCLGCQLYVLFIRLGVIRPKASAVTSAE